LRLAFCSLALWAASAIAAQGPATLLDRLRSADLPADQRAELARFFTAKDYAQVEAILDRVTAAPLAPAVAAECHALAGAVAFLEGRMERAVTSLRQADALVPLDDRDRFTLAMALVKLSDIKSAREQLMRLTVDHPDVPLYLYWLARIDYDQRLYEQAIEKLRRVIRLDPESSRAYDNLGLALDMLGQTDEARQAFEKGVQLNRKLPEPSAWPPQDLGALLLRMQQFKEAEAALREALRYDSEVPMAHYHLGRTLEAEDRDNEAIEEYRAATAGPTPVVEAFYSLGLLYRRHDRSREAETAFAAYRKWKAQPAQ